MYGNVIGAVIGAVAGGVAGGIYSWKTTMENAEAYQKAANDIRKYTQEYSGQSGYEKMLQEGLDQTSTFGTIAGNELSANKKTPTMPGTGYAGATAVAHKKDGEVGEVANQAAQAGFEQGMANQQARNQALYNANTALAQQKLNQADIDYKAKTQAAQEIGNTVANAAQTYNSIRGRRTANEPAGTNQ